MNGNVGPSVNPPFRSNKTIVWISTEIRYIHIPLRMNCDSFDYTLSSHLPPSFGQNIVICPILIQLQTCKTNGGSGIRVLKIVDPDSVEISSVGGITIPDLKDMPFPFLLSTLPLSQFSGFQS